MTTHTHAHSGSERSACDTPAVPADAAVATIVGEMTGDDGPATRGNAAEANLAAAPRKPRRVLHLINGEHFAGAERVQDLLALSLPAFGYEVEFARVLPGRFDQARRSTVALHELPMGSKLDLRPAWKLARLLRRGDFACLHTHTPRTVMVGRLAASLARIPLVHHLHGQTATEVTGTLKTRFYAWLERRCFRKAARVIAVSETSRQYLLRQGVPSQHIALVPNGVPSPAALPELAPPNAHWQLGTVGLFRPRKGLETLLEALALARQQGLPVRWRGIGPFETAEYESDVRRRAVNLGLGDGRSEEGPVYFAGFCSDVPAALAQLDLFIFPSILPEGMPMVVLEAFGAGVPVVASAVDGVTDVVQDGQTGWLVPPADPAALARAIGRVVSGQLDWRAIRRNAHQTQRQRYSESSLAAGVAAVYDEVLAPSRARMPRP